MKCSYSCNSPEHVISRRSMLGGLAAGTGAVCSGLGWLARPAAARQLEKDQKRIVVFNMAGGLSQLESWDPKPGTDTGGPFRAIPTSVPGIHISELLPLTARQMHHLALVRSINTKENDHGKGRYMMITGHRQMPATDYPAIGAVAAKGLERADNPLPGHVRIGGGGRGSDAAYLGPRYASIGIGGGPPKDSVRPKSLTADADEQRHALRRRLNDRFASRRRTAQTDAYTQSYERALQFMQQRDLFDVSKESAKQHDRYGSHKLGQHCLLARRLLEGGVPFVQVTHSNYDTHNENFTFHVEQLGEFDRAFSTLVADLFERGMLDSTLLVVLSEFGRTPRINQYLGRDHWGSAWSVALGGAGIARGAVIGKTNKNGTAVADRQVDHANLFHTYLQAVGLDSAGEFDLGGRPVPLADPASKPIEELLV